MRKGCESCLNVVLNIIEGSEQVLTLIGDWLTRPMTMIARCDAEESTNADKLEILAKHKDLEVRRLASLNQYSSPEVRALIHSF